LNSGLLPLFFVLPIPALVYGWTSQEEVGALALPIDTAFAGGMGLIGSFNGLNTYTAGKSSLTPRRLKDGGDMLMRRELKGFFPIRD
jgi:hypothetical protein